MVSYRMLCGLSTVVALANGQAIIQKAVGDKGQSQSLLVNAKDANDANVISTPEIAANIVNECGRTLLAGNIDIGEQTEIALTDGQVTQSTKGGKVTVTIDQKNNQGSGPFTCDMDLTSNTNGATGQTPLKVTQNKADFGTGLLTLEVEMPKDMACIGASTGDVCTVRCFNKQSFGGCFAVQQTDTTPNENAPNNIETVSSLDAILKQVAQDQKDFEVSANAIAESSLDAAEQGTTVADAIIENNADILDNAGNNNNNGGNGNGNNNNNNGGGRGGNNNNNGGNGRGGNNNNAGNGNAGGNNNNNNAGNGRGGNNNNNNAGGNAGNNANGRGGNNNNNAGNAGNAANRGGNNNNNNNNNNANNNNGNNRNNNNRKRSNRVVRKFKA